jgi:hypothetical protein
MDYEGIIIEESLEDRSVLDSLQVLDRKVELTTPHHETPWLSQWTLITVRLPEATAGKVAQALSVAIDSEHAGSWYAEFKNDAHHYVVYRDRVFYIDRRSREQYAEAVDYGVSRGLPEHQADFVALIEG